MKMICGLFLKGRHIGMKVSIIDNSLCDSSFVSDVKPEAIKAYTDALHEFGVNSVSYTHLDVYKRQVFIPCKSI